MSIRNKILIFLLVVFLVLLCIFTKGCIDKGFSLLGTHKATPEQLEIMQKLELSHRVDTYIIQSRLHDKEPPLPPEEVNIISMKAIELSTKYNIRVEYLLGLWRAESKFNRFAVSPVGALGLSQVMKPTFSEFGTGDFYDWNANTEAGARYFLYLQGLFGNDFNRILAAYNAGPFLHRKETFRRAGNYVAIVKQYQTQASLIINSI